MNDDIAGRLVLSTRTVDHDVSAVLAKLGVGSRGAAAAQARSLGLLPAVSEASGPGRFLPHARAQGG
jgi:ATP/maltotriose-dependent transcriptional regulator MalT